MTRTFFSLPTLLWISAFICALYFKNDWQIELFASAVLIMIVWTGIMLSKGAKEGFSIPQSWVMRFMGLFTLLSFVSIFHSDITYVSLMGFAFYSVLPLSFLVFALYPDKDRFKVIAYGLAVIYSVLSVWAMIQFFFLNEMFNGHAHHPIANPNSLAALLNLGLFASVGWVLVAEDKRSQILSTILAVLIVGGLMSTSSRGAFFSMIIFMPIMLFFLKDHVRKKYPYILIIIAAVVLFFVLTTLGVHQGNRLISRIFNTITFANADVTNNRLNIWAGTIAIIKDHWLFGTGIGTFFVYYRGYRTPEEIYGVHHAHSDPLQYWAEMGILGPILFYGLLMSVLVRTIKSVRKVDKLSKERLVVLTIFFGLCAVTLHTHVTFNFHNLSILMASGFLLAIWLTATHKLLPYKLKHLDFPTSLSKPFRIVLITLPLLIFALLTIPKVMSEKVISTSKEKMMTGDIRGALNDVSFANVLSNNSNPRAYTLLASVSLALLEESLPQLTQKQKKYHVEQAHAHIKRALELNPRSSPALFYYASLRKSAPLDLMPEGIQSEEFYYERALGYDKTHLAARVALADIYIDRGETEKGHQVLIGGFDMHYNRPFTLQYYNRMASVFLERGDMERHKQALYKLKYTKERFGL